MSFIIHYWEGIQRRRRETYQASLCNQYFDQQENIFILMHYFLLLHCFLKALCLYSWNNHGAKFSSVFLVIFQDFSYMIKENLQPYMWLSNEFCILLDIFHEKYSTKNYFRGWSSLYLVTLSFKYEIFEIDISISLSF
jgi:hypothetical protein